MTALSLYLHIFVPLRKAHLKTATNVDSFPVFDSQDKVCSLS